MPIFLQAAAVFQWTDEQGNVGFTDDPDSIPEKYRQNAEQLDSKPVPKKPKTNITPALPPDTDPTGTPPMDVDDDGHDEQWWRERMQELRHRKEVLLAEKARLAEDTGMLGRLGLGNVEENQQAKETEDRIQQLDSEISQIDHELTVVVPEEARKANAPPGWLRE
jgi:hypothetical protein